MSIRVETFVTGPIETNTMLVANAAGDALLVDPSLNCNAALQQIETRGLTLHAVLLTHGHFDHTIGLPEVLADFPDTAVYIHPADRHYLTDVNYNGSPMIGRQFTYDGPVRALPEGPMEIGTIALEVIHVPGHSPGGVALLFDNQCLCGDSVFAGSIGRTDFIGGDAELLIRSIRERLLTLPAHTVLYPGHGPATTVGKELKYNPFLK